MMRRAPRKSRDSLPENSLKFRSMSDSHLLYDNPLIGRYASREMAERWGPRRKFGTWRRLWLWLAQAKVRSDCSRRRQIAAHPPRAIGADAHPFGRHRFPPGG